MLWPPFPPNYYDILGKHYCRWGGARSYKYEVPRLHLDAGGVGVLARWAGDRFSLWLQERRLVNHVTQPRVVELPFRAEAVETALRYQVGELTSTFAQSITVYHGTYPECVAQILHTGRLHCSNNHIGLGMECRTPFPAVFTADTMHHALRYAWPSNFLLDNLYYGVILELEADSTRILQRREGEVLLPPDALRIKGMYLILNLAVAKGRAKSAEWVPALELLPASLRTNAGTLLRPHPIRRTAWHAESW